MADEGTLRLEARAKANLLLRVLGREADGFHSLETLFVRLALADEVEVGVGRDEPGLTVETDAGDGEETERAGGVPEGPDNLCWEAAERFYREADLPPSAHITLRKRIPVAAGLGGGSADAAAVLRGLSELHDRPLPGSRLLQVAAAIGSDVPFALVDCPAALAWGRGSRLLPVPAPPPRPALIVAPPWGIRSGDAYGWLDEEREAEGTAAGDGVGRDAAVYLPEPSDLGRWEVLRSLAANDFEEPVFRFAPALRELRDELAADAPGPVLLCGSGSALLAVYEDEERRDAAAGAMSDRDVGSVIPTTVPA